MLTKKQISEANKKAKKEIEALQTEVRVWTLAKQGSTTQTFYMGTMLQASHECEVMRSYTGGFWYLKDSEETIACPGCQRVTAKSIIDSLGECLFCDHLVSDDVPLRGVLPL